MGSGESLGFGFLLFEEEAAFTRDDDVVFFEDECLTASPPLLCSRFCKAYSD